MSDQKLKWELKVQNVKMLNVQMKTSWWTLRFKSGKQIWFI